MQFYIYSNYYEKIYKYQSLTATAENTTIVSLEKKKISEENITHFV